MSNEHATIVDRLLVYIKATHARTGAIPPPQDAAQGIGVSESSARNNYTRLVDKGHLTQPWGAKRGYAPGWDWKTPHSLEGLVDSPYEEVIDVSHREYTPLAREDMDRITEEVRTETPTAMRYRPLPSESIQVQLRLLLNQACVVLGEPVSGEVGGQQVEALANIAERNGERKPSYTLVVGDDVLQSGVMSTCIEAAVERLST